MSIQVIITSENTSENYWKGFVKSNYTIRPFHVTSDVIVIGGLSYKWPKDTDGDIVIAVTECMKMYIKPYKSTN